MKKMTRILTGVAAVGLVSGATLMATNVAEAGESTIDWKPCEGTEKVQCGSVEVPLDWSKPDGPTIDIGLAKREASDPDKREGSILMDPGGPGGSGTEYIKDGNPFTDKVSQRYDAIGFDPRGVGSSEPVKCDEELTQKAVDAQQVSSKDGFDKLSDLNKKLYDDCKKRSGDVVDHADNLQTVEDMEAIRVALGEGDLNYLGYSYGTLMGQQYAEKYPDKIRSMVLDGNMDHSITDPWEFARSETAPVEENFNEFSAWCESTKDCALYGKDVKDTYSDLKQRARDGELTDPESGDTIDFFDLSGITFGANDPSGWKDLAASYDAMESGKGKVSAKANHAEEMNYVSQSAFCGDYGFEVDDYSDWKSIRGQLSEKFPNVEYTSYVNFIAGCVGAPVENKNPQQELDVDDDTSMLMIGNEHDPATVYEWTEAASEQSGSDLLTYEGYNHTIYGKDGASKCVNNAIDAYYLDLKRPEPGDSCPAQKKPGSGKNSDGRNLPGPWGQ